MTSLVYQTWITISYISSISIIWFGSLESLYNTSSILYMYNTSSLSWDHCERIYSHPSLEATSLQTYDDVERINRTLEQLVRMLIC